MALNMYKVKWWFVCILLGMLPALAMLTGLIVMDNLLIGMLLELVAIIVLSFVSEIIMRHPLTDMLKGKGLLTLSLDSTGIIVPFISGLKPNKLVTVVDGKNHDTTFDRDMISYFTNPVKADLVEIPIKDKEGNVLYTDKYLKIPGKLWEYNYQFDAYPTLLFDRNSESFLSKDFMKMREDERYEHSLMKDIIRKTDDLTQPLRDFARYVVEQTRPKKGFPTGAALGILAVIIILGLVAFFIYNGGTSAAVDQATQIITPR